MNKEAGRTQVSFHFSPASSYVLPLQSIRERIQGIWESLTWPVIKRIIKADLAATIAFALLMIEPIRRLTDYGIILAQIAVHFIHPAKSYGSLVEDIIFGTLMCIVAAGWSLLGTFCSSLVRNPDSTELAQPKVSGVLVIFLVIGAFCLNYLRARVDQANLGGMLSATILVISLTSAVLDKEWYPRTVLQTFVPVTVGFGIVFVIGIILWPENSTRICVEQLVKTLETFDGIARRQVEGFLHMGTFPRDESIYLSSGAAGPPPESLPVVHRLLDSSLSSLVEKKRIVRREISFNYIAPKDVSEMTKLLKKMRVPLQGISLSRAMEENMRKAHLQRHVARRLEEFAEKENLDPSANASNATLQSASRKNCTHRGKSCKEESAAAGMSCISLSSTSSSCASPSSSSDDSLSTYEDDAPPPTVNPTLETPPPVEEGPGPRFNEKDADSDDEEEDHVKTDSPDTHITIALPPGDGFSAWRREYNEILKTVRPIYHSLLQACSSAVHDTIVRLQYLQRIDPQFQDKPHIYRMFAKKEPPTKFDKDFDPSIQLLKAIQEFDMYRLRGLERLYHPGEKPIPRRILFLLLHFQFNLRGYAERVYTLSSLVYEMVQARGEKRRLWMPHLSVRKFFGRRQVEADVGLDPPTTIVEAHNMESLQRTLSHRATHIMLNDELTAPQTQPSPSQPAQVNLLSLPKRGELRYHHRRHKRSTSLEQETAQLRGGSVDAAAEGGLDPLMYHDPDVAYPTTPFQRFCYNLWQFWARYVRTADTAFALRACAVVTVLTIPGFVEDSLDWYNRARGQWAAVVALVWMGPSVGSNFFGVMVRTVGTFIGAICSILVWEISRVNRIGLTILMFFFDLPWWVIYLNGKFWRAAGLFSLITTSIVIGYAYNYQMSGKDISMYEVLYERTICVLIGVVVALIFSVFPLPRTGRVELRHRIARTLGDLAALYSSFLALLLKNAQRDPHVSMSNRKVFRMVAAAIRKQIKGQRVLLEQSRFEPALRGIFPEDKYVHILQVLENIVCLMIDMESALERIPERWRLELVQNTWKERKTAIASFLTALHMGANALSNKCPLPPYVLRPTRARRELTNKARQIRNLRPERLGDPEYTYYSAYLMSSEQLAVEIESLVATIRDLVGPDSVSVWLEYKH